MAALRIFALFLLFPLLASQALIIKFPVPSGGPETFVFVSAGEAITGVNDGRVLKYEGPEIGWVDFAYTSPSRTKELCDGIADPKMGNICGRPLGLGFKYETSELYIADAYHGLCVVGREGGLARQLVSYAGGLPLKWPDGLAIDVTTGKIYFTDVSTQYNLSQIQEYLASDDSTGRLIEYEPETKKTRVLLTGLKGAVGTGASADGSFVLVSELTGGKITKYWLTGPKAYTWETILKISAPGNLKITPSKEYWIAANMEENGTNIPVGIRIDQYGTVLEKVAFGPGLNNVIITEVHEHIGDLFVGSMWMDYGAKYTAPENVKGTETDGIKAFAQSYQFAC